LFKFSFHSVLFIVTLNKKQEQTKQNKIQKKKKEKTKNTQIKNKPTKKNQPKKQPKRDLFTELLLLSLQFSNYYVLQVV
jgi:hypothetical protein